MSFIPKFGYPDLCGQSLIDWALKNKETAFSVFEPQLPPLHHKYKVAGLQPYQIQSVINALKARFPGDFTLTRQHPAQPDFHLGRRVFVNVEAVRLAAAKKAQEFTL